MDGAGLEKAKELRAAAADTSESLLRARALVLNSDERIAGDEGGFPVAEGTGMGRPRLMLVRFSLRGAPCSSSRRVNFSSSACSTMPSN
jgi:hypothetical protein